MPSSIKIKKNIVIEGPIGVGKSSLAKKIAHSQGAHLLLEQAAENPFLESFYQGDRMPYALQTQLFFLFQRVEQLSRVATEVSATESVVADFMIDKDPLFAKLTLSNDELVLYQKVFGQLNIKKPKIDLMIYLQAPVDVLQERINKRRIRYEMGMDKRYLESLSDCYTQFFHRYFASPLLIVNAAEINPVDNEAHYRALLTHISQIDAGKHYFNPSVEVLG